MILLAFKAYCPKLGGQSVFILKPRLGMRIIWLDIGMAKESIIITVEENQAILVGPDLYVKKIKTLLDASL